MSTHISDNIKIHADVVIAEIAQRQQLPWNNGRISDYNQFPELQKLFRIINSGIPREDFFFQGDLFRLHTTYVTLEEYVDPSKERITGKVCSDGSCEVIPLTEYSDTLVAFSKSYDFTDRRVYYKVYPSDKAIMIHSNTKDLYGIDVNAFMDRFGVKQKRYSGEQEVLFPILRDYVVKEYEGTPNKFKYYLRSYSKG